MKLGVAPVKNVMSLHIAYQKLVERDPGIPGIGLVHGFTGAGKSTAVAQLVAHVEGVYVRASAVWSPQSMLQSIVAELRGLPMTKNAAMVSYIIKELATARRPLFVDEADYLLDNLKMLETLRDIHDNADVPVVLIGMDGIQKRITRREQFTRRIAEWVEFKALDAADTRTLATTICEVSVADDLLAKLHKAAGGSVGLMTVGLSKIEAEAKKQAWGDIDAERWGDKPFFLGKAPRTA